MSRFVKFWCPDVPGSAVVLSTDMIAAVQDYDDWVVVDGRGGWDRGFTDEELLAVDARMPSVWIALARPLHLAGQREPVHGLAAWASDGGESDASGLVAAFVEGDGWAMPHVWHRKVLV